MANLTRSDWGDVDIDEDYSYAFDKFYGKSLAEAVDYLKGNSNDAFECVENMNSVPFRVYFSHFVNFVRTEGIEHDDSYSMADAVFEISLRKLKNEPSKILPIMEDVLSCLHFISEHQEEYDADEDIFGNFQKKYKVIHDLYMEGEGR